MGRGRADTWLTRTNPAIASRATITTSRSATVP
jgi:hypothetical protein